MIKCPNCGERTKEEISIYNDDLRRQSFSFTPILPTCKKCGAEVDITHRCKGGKIIIITGTCGSGKSTVAELIANTGFLAIDGDCVIQVVKHKKNTKQVNFEEMLEEIACEIDILSLFGSNIVLAHVVTPELLDGYIKMLQERNMNYSFFLLKPDCQTAVERCQTRTCHTSITPEYWIKHFFDTLVFDDRVDAIDNTYLSAEETATCIMGRCRP